MPLEGGDSRAPSAQHVSEQSPVTVQPASEKGPRDPYKNWEAAQLRREGGEGARSSPALLQWEGIGGTFLGWLLPQHTLIAHERGAWC